MSMLVFFYLLYEAFLSFSWSASFRSVFGSRRSLGLIYDYKLIRGHSKEDHLTSSVRVLQTLRIDAPVNLKQSGLRESGFVTTKYSLATTDFKKNAFGSMWLGAMFVGGRSVF